MPKRLDGFHVGGVYWSKSLVASFWTERLGTFLQAPALASYWHQDFATCVSIKTMPTTPSEALAAR